MGMNGAAWTGKQEMQLAIAGKRYYCFVTVTGSTLTHSLVCTLQVEGNALTHATP